MCPLVVSLPPAWSTFTGADKRVPVLHGKRMKNRSELCVNICGNFFKASESYKEMRSGNFSSTTPCNLVLGTEICMFPKLSRDT